MLERRIAGFLVKNVFRAARRGGPWADPADLRHERLEFEGNTGARLVGTWFPADRPKGVVVLVHPDRRYARQWFAREGWVHFLHASGYEVLSFDLAGYGESRGPATYYYEDVIAASHVAREWAGGLPVHVVGVSLGAFATAVASPDLPHVESIVLESPYASFNAWYGKGPYERAMRAFDRLFPRTASIIQADRRIARAAPKRILVALAENDTLTAPALTEAVARAAPADRTRLLRVPGGHLELFRRDEYRREILATFGAQPGYPSEISATFPASDNNEPRVPFKPMPI